MVRTIAILCPEVSRGKWAEKETTGRINTQHRSFGRNSDECQFIKYISYVGLSEKNSEIYYHITLH